MSLHVLVTERLSPGLRGALSQWFVELNPGVYAGSISARVRDEIWQQVEAWVAGHQIGYALVIHPDDCEQGFAMQSVGSSRYSLAEHLGVTLISRQHEKRQIRPDVEEIDPGW